ncbi:MAG: D-alanyl-D-alanine carboxypeptidase/D-alanyl-D-alanine-endopeptidase, partial [Planctomycetota bacterium]
MRARTERRNLPGGQWAKSVLAAVVLATACVAAARPIDDAAKEVRERVQAYERGSGAKVGLSIVDARTGRPVLGMRRNELMIPASNQKLLTSAFALSKLGTGFRFTTAVYLVGEDLVILGDGDPTLGDPRLARKNGRSVYAELDGWVKKVRARLGSGATVDNVLLVRRRKRQPLRHPDWSEYRSQDDYVAPVCELNFYNNCLDVTFQVGGGRVYPKVKPASRLITIVDRLRKGRRHIWSLSMNGDDSKITLRGRVTQTTSEPYSVAVNRPGLLLGRVFADRLERAGVRVTGDVRVVAKPPRQPTAGNLVAYTRTRLEKAMYRANKRSLNMAAESLFLRAGDFTWLGSAEEMQGTLQQSFRLSSRSLKVRDGSGLSKDNRVTPAALTQLLTGVLEYRDATVLLDSLPVSGMDGSLRRRMNTGTCRGRVLGKTGTLARVSTLSGYILDSSNRPVLAYAVLVNDIPSGQVWKARQLQDAICTELVEAVGAGHGRAVEADAGVQRHESEGIEATEQAPRPPAV